MKRLLAAIFALLLCCNLRAEQVIDLPQDGGRYYTSIFLNEASNIPGWFQSDARLATLKAQTQFNVVQTSDPQFAERYGKAVTEFPCVAITKADGSLIFKASGKNLPNNSADLVAMIRAAAAVKTQNAGPERYCQPDTGHESCRCRPKPAPVVQPTPPVDEKVPDLLGGEMAEAEAEPRLPVWLGVMLGVAGAGFAIVPQIMKKYKSLEMKAA